MFSSPLSLLSRLSRLSRRLGVVELFPRFRAGHVSLHSTPTPPLSSLLLGEALERFEKSDLGRDGERERIETDLLSLRQKETRETWIRRGTQILDTEMIYSVAQWKALSGADRQRFPVGLRKVLDCAFCEDEYSKRFTQEESAVQNNHVNTEWRWIPLNRHEIVLGSILFLFGYMLYTDLREADLLERESATLGENESLVDGSQIISNDGSCPTSAVSPTLTSTQQENRKVLLHDRIKFETTMLLSFFLVFIAILIDHRVHVPPQALREFSSWKAIHSWKDYLSVLSSFLSAGIIFGLIDNGGLLLGMDTIEDYVVRVFGNDAMTIAALGNMYSDVLGAFLGAYIGSTLLKLAKWSGASAPPWMQALGIGIGCFIPVVGRIMYVRSKTESVPD